MKHKKIIDLLVQSTIIPNASPKLTINKKFLKSILSINFPAHIITDPLIKVAIALGIYIGEVN